MRRWSLPLLVLVVLVVILAARLVLRQEPAAPGAGATSSDDVMPSSEVSRDPGAVPTPQPVRLTPATTLADAETQFGTLSGRVVSSDSGLAVPSSEVTLLKEGAAHSVTTLPDGSFAFQAPSAGQYELTSVSAEGFADFSPRFGQSPVMFEARPGLGVRNVVIYLSPLSALHGRVVDEDDHPVAGARINARHGDLTGFDPSTAPGTFSDAKGKFELQVAGIVLLVAEHPDYLGGSAWADPKKTESAPVTVTLMSRAEGATGGRITGTVVDPDNGPVEAALVTAKPSVHHGRHDAGRGVEAALTDRAGAFVIPVVSAGSTTYSVVASAKGYGEARAKAVSPDGPALTLKLEAGLRLVGQVVGGKGARPVPAFSLFLSRSGLGHSTRTLSFLDGEGRYEVPGLTAGKVHVRVAAFGFASSDDVEVTIPAKGGPVVHDVTLERGSRVHGVVGDGVTHRPVTGARVTVEGEFANDESVVSVQSVATTNDRGEFALEGVAKGLRTISVAATGFHTRLISGLQAEADGDIGPLTIELTPTPAGEDSKTELTGIGAGLAATKGGFEVVNVLDGGGAERVGIVRGDIIVAIDGTPAKTLELSTLVEQIRGEEGSVVRLTVQRADGSQVELAVVRRRVLF